MKSEERIREEGDKRTSILGDTGSGAVFKKEGEEELQDRPLV